MRARMALYYAGIKVVLREVHLRHKPLEMLAASPKATVPILLLDDGAVLDESLDIMMWSLAVSDPDAWQLNLDEQQIVANKIITENDGEFKKYLDLYKYADRSPELKLQETRAKGEVFLAKLEERLQKHTYLMSDQCCYVDVAVFPFVRQFAYVDKDWFDATPYPCLQQWLQYWLDSTIFNAVMKKTPVWETNASDVFLAG